MTTSFKRFIWRVRLWNTLASYPFGWNWRDAWEYADSMAETYFDDDPKAWSCPNAALDEDRSYWGD